MEYVIDRIKRLLSWAQRNERHLGAVLFVFGFGTDLITFALLPVTFVNLAFLGYLALATICTLGSHLFSRLSEEATLWRKTLAVLFPLGAQYAIGSLLSGCLIFYAKSAAVFVSWPFLLILALVFIGNEYFRKYYEHLAFQVLLLFFGIYAYAIFALPLVLHRLGSWVFLGSTAIAVIALALVLRLMARLGRAGYEQSLRYVIPGAALIVVVMCASYFTGIIPPIPLTMPAAGIYHDVHREGDHYVVALENERPWWDIRTQVIHHVPGTPLFAYSAVSAPFAFGTSVVHVWEHKEYGKWVERSRATFRIAGGRDGGYRGYSEVLDAVAGDWRVTIETTDRQVIGRLYATVETVTEPPLIKEENR